jgi:hypothetical protein
MRKEGSSDRTKQNSHDAREREGPSKRGKESKREKTDRQHRKMSLNSYLSILTSTARLLLVSVLEVGLEAGSLAESHLRKYEKKEQEKTTNRERQWK